MKLTVIYIVENVIYTTLASYSCGSSSFIEDTASVLIGKTKLVSYPIL